MSYLFGVSRQIDLENGLDMSLFSPEVRVSGGGCEELHIYSVQEY
jgi:hypothetical protein